MILGNLPHLLVLVETVSDKKNKYSTYLIPPNNGIYFCKDSSKWTYKFTGDSNLLELGSLD